ncbi:MAG TPA: hypothetical protein PLG15_00980 [Candidatus Gastranaerophilaceae bacterium]|nr:hypothetical protein [Candidatus Gastranaerophilaceae bacterium]HPT40940.1 hypothetical protein [Candidatus Gastranaerophilaceae bacterium]
MSILNKNIVKITSEDLKDATLSSAGFDGETQKRAFANILGARLAIKLLFSKKIEANNIYSLYTMQSVLKNIDISDIYFENIKIDVRLVFDKNEIFIPKSHFEYDILPDIYIPLLLKKDMSSAEILGFFEPKEIDKNNSNKDFYFFEADKLHKPESLKKFISLFIQKSPKKSKLEDLQKSESLFGEFVDDEISDEDKLFLIQQLNANLYLREKLVELENFELLSKKSISEEVFSHDMLFEEGINEEIPEEKSLEISEEESEIKSEDFLELPSEGVFEEQLHEELTEQDLENIQEEVPFIEEFDSALPDEKQEPESAVQEEEIKEQNYQSELVSLDSLVGEELFTEGLPEKQENIDVPLEEIDFSQFESIGEVQSDLAEKNEDLDAEAEELISKKNAVSESEEDTDDESIKSKIDELLEELETSEEAKEALSDEIEIIEGLVSSSEGKSSESFDLSDFETVSSDELEFFTPEAETEAEAEKKDKDLINILFEKENIKATDDMDSLSEPSVHKKAYNININKKVIVAASIAGLMLVATVGGVLITKHNSQNNSIVQNEINQNIPPAATDNTMPQDFTQNAYQPDGNMPLTPPPGQYQSQGRDMSKAVSDAFLSTPINATVSKIAWEAPEDLAYSDSFRKYLQMAGKNLKLTLQNDLLLSSEMAYSNKVIVDISMNKGGTIKTANISVSSGSKQIDNIVLQSVKETLKYLKMPTDEIQGSSVDLTLIINF